MLLGQDNDAGDRVTELSGGTQDLPALQVDGGVSVRGGLSVDAVSGGGSVFIVPGQPASDDDYPMTIEGYVALDGDQGTNDILHGFNVLQVKAVTPAHAVNVVVTDGDPDPSHKDPAGSAMSLTTGGALGLGVTTSTGAGVNVTVTDPTADLDAVQIAYAGTGHAVSAISTSSGNTTAAVLGTNEGTGVGVSGVAPHGRGGQFSGGLAPLRLVPGSTPSHLWVGAAGDLYVDSNHRLWFCQKAHTPTVPATWKQLA